MEKYQVVLAEYLFAIAALPLLPLDHLRQCLLPLLIMLLLKKRYFFIELFSIQEVLLSHSLILFNDGLFAGERGEQKLSLCCVN